MRPRGIEERLRSAPSTALAGVLVRCVFQADFDEGNPRRYLYTSAARNRYNPAGIHTLYLAEDHHTAIDEHEAAWTGTARAREPVILFRAAVKVAAALDLTVGTTVANVGLQGEDLFANWVLASAPTKLQELGRALAAQGRFAAIRYPSAVRHRAGQPGANVVIFRDALATGDSVEIFGWGGAVVERWP